MKLVLNTSRGTHTFLTEASFYVSEQLHLMCTADIMMLKQVVGIGKAIYGSNRAKLRPFLCQTSCGFHNGRVRHLPSSLIDYLIK